MRWLELTVETHPEAIESVSELLSSYTTGGVAIEEPIELIDEGQEYRVLAPIREPLCFGSPDPRAPSSWVPPAPRVRSLGTPSTELPLSSRLCRDGSDRTPWR